MEHISNQELSLTISPVGAEMQTLTDKRDNRELLWHGDSKYWGGRSPILFPAVGGLWNATYRHGGKSFNMPKHGFVREIEWEVAARSGNSITFAHERTAGEAEVFPWPYRVEVEYVLEGRRVRVLFRVKNDAAEEMFFQMGGHPGFSLPDFSEDETVSGFLRFTGHADHLLRAADQGCTLAERFPVPTDADGDVPVCVGTFADEALILPGGQVSAVTLLRKDRSPLVRVESTAPVWLVWAPQNEHAPFVCFEPWYGLCDPIGFDGDVSERPFINRLGAGEEWQGGYEITVY